MEKQNIVATVQRSKSAQTPLQRKKNNNSKSNKEMHEQENSNMHPMVRRSHSMRSPVVPIVAEFSETEVLTPSKVKRHFSDCASNSGKRPTIKPHAGTPRYYAAANRKNAGSARPVRTGLKI